MDFGNFNVTGYNSTGMAMPFSGGSGMDPISALISGGAQLIGGFMNQNQQENASELNYQMNLSQQRGDYIPQYLANLRRGAEKSGFNPLAVLGQRFPGPTFAAGADTALGDAVGRAGAAMAGAFDPQKAARDDLTLKQMDADYRLKELNNINMQVKHAMDLAALDELVAARRAGRGYIPPGWGPPSVFSDLRERANNLFPPGKRGVYLPGGTYETPPFMKWYDEFRKKALSSGQDAPRSWFHQE